MQCIRVLFGGCCSGLGFQKEASEGPKLRSLSLQQTRAIEGDTETLTVASLCFDEELACRILLIAQVIYWKPCSTRNFCF